MHAKLLHLCPILCDSMDCSLPDSSVHGILQTRILEWVAMPSSRGSSWPRGRTHVLCLLHLQASSVSSRTSLVAQTVKRLSTIRETWVQSLGWEDLLEKEMAIHSSTIAWKISWTEEPGRLQSMGSQRVGHDWATELNWIYTAGSQNHCRWWLQPWN